MNPITTEQAFESLMISAFQAPLNMGQNSILRNSIDHIATELGLKLEGDKVVRDPAVKIRRTVNK